MRLEVKSARSAEKTANVPVPSWILRCALTLSGRSDTDPYRIYDASRLQAAGFRPTVSLVSALDAYAAWYRAQSSATGAP